ncbi:Chaperone protein dnaJ [Rhynchospora pubera]|uniref:Chaperone protein dnaJ n=1 Tax=Rhynchospora pubera TaxID=906938 RepID=A0AAV8DRI7_9POAL|nr:Chaperone protein dnaJ [Rhynchospora pubera]
MTQIEAWSWRAFTGTGSSCLSRRHIVTSTTTAPSSLSSSIRFRVRGRSRRSEEDYESEPDHYAVLGVPRGATRAQIKQAYRLLALKHHPDVSPLPHPSSPHLFLSISAAYHVSHLIHLSLLLHNLVLTALPTPNCITLSWPCSSLFVAYLILFYFLIFLFSNIVYQNHQTILPCPQKDNYYSYPEPIRYYRWPNFKKRTRRQNYSAHNLHEEAVEQDKTLHENQETFSGVLRFSFFALFLVKTVGQFVALTLCALLPLFDDELDNGYKLGYLVSWLLGGQTGVILMLFVRFASWLCGKSNSGRLVLVVLAMWVGVSLARFIPLPQGAILAPSRFWRHDGFFFLPAWLHELIILYSTISYFSLVGNRIYIVAPFTCIIVH